MSQAATPRQDYPADLVPLFVRTVRALGRAGRPVEASRLAAQAWWLLRESAPDAAEHVNGVMHYLARLPAEQSAASGSPATAVHTDPDLTSHSRH